jgi:hypothetical protein
MPLAPILPIYLSSFELSFFLSAYLFVYVPVFLSLDVRWMVPHKVNAHCGLENRAKEVMSRLCITNYVSVRSCGNLSIGHCIGRVISDILYTYIC